MLSGAATSPSPHGPALGRRRRLLLTACLVTAGSIGSLIHAPSAAAGVSPAEPTSESFGGSPPAELLELSAGPDADSYVVAVAGEAALRAVLDALQTMGVQPTNTWQGGLNGFAAVLDRDQVVALSRRDDVASVELDHEMTAAETQIDPPWGLDRIDQRTPALDARYTPSATPTGVTAYVIDSGLWLSHTEFTGRVLRAAYWDFGDGTLAWDCAGHGTHVAGTLGGTNYGVAKQVGIVPVKVLNCAGAGSAAAMLAGINWVINDHAAGRPAVANISVGGPASPTVDAAVEALIADGVTVVTAAGNDAMSTCNYSPARVSAAITVAASEMNDDAADFSNAGPCNDIFAPGSGVLSAYAGADDATAVRSGTSMASPHVAGAAALVLAAQPGVSPAAVWGSLDASSTKGAITECCGEPDKLLYVGPPPVSPLAPAFVALAPHRLLDTRLGAGLRAPGSSTAVGVTGVGGVPGDAAAVALNVTVTEPGGPGYFTVYPCGAPQPTASNLNFLGGQTIPNAVVAQVGSGGSVCVYSSTTAHLIVDVNGWFAPGAGFGPLSPGRLLDTREGLGIRPAGSVTPLHVVGERGVSSSASAVALNVTVTEPQSAGYVTVYPCGVEPPDASNLNYAAGQSIANAVVAQVGSNGDICLYSSASTHLVVDVNGWFAPGTGFGPLSPGRLVDTRLGAGLRAPGTVTPVQVGTLGGVPSTASAVVLNVTVTEPQAPGYVTVYPCGVAPPDASNLNFAAAGQTIPNAVFAKLDASGMVCLYNSAATQLIVDVNGWFY